MFQNRLKNKLNGLLPIQFTIKLHQFGFNKHIMLEMSYFRNVKMGVLY